ncbi:MAG: lytic transglycosylase domain-containing protein [Desulfobacterales bacterium]|nr:lytic transglycosylase domain-containing protein [Desulfobacterales bacterium]
MQFKTFGKTICISIILFFAAPLIQLYGEPLSEQTSQYHFPPLIQSIRFDNNIEYCNIKIPLDRQEIKERLEKEMLLALWSRPQVILWIKRAAKFFPHVEKILKEHGLPLDLRYVPLIESALRPHATSSKNAVGYWQFIKSTGKHYGLRIDSKVDERRNIFKSTHAACKYLKDLEKQFGSYLLALSAYNMGEYGLKGEIKAQNTDDFFSLYLPLQTQRYIFKMVSAKLILENQQLYGFSLNKSDLYPLFAFDKVSVESDFPIPIALIAQSADTPFKAIKDYNPELRGYSLGKGGNTILIPKGKAKGFKKSFAVRYKNWEKTVKTRFHVVKTGESLIRIAKKHQISLSSLLKLNNLSVKGVIHPGDRLVIE